MRGEPRVAYFLAGPLKGQTMMLSGPFHYVKAPVMELYPAVSVQEEDVVPDWEDEPLGRISDVLYVKVGQHGETHIFDVDTIYRRPA